MMAAALPAPSQSTRSGRKDRSGSAPKSITSGVSVKSNRFLLPAAKAIGKAIEKASTRPHVKLRKLCAMRSRKAGSCTDEKSVTKTPESVGRFERGIKLNRVTASHAVNPIARGISHRLFVSLFPERTLLVNDKVRAF